MQLWTCVCRFFKLSFDVGCVCVSFALDSTDIILTRCKYSVYHPICKSVQFSHSVMSDSATTRTTAHQASLSITNFRSLLKLMSVKSVMSSSADAGDTISSVVSFFSCLQSFPASGSFPVSQFFKSGGQSTGVSGSASVLPMNIQDWFPLRLSGLISLQSKGLSRVFSNNTVQSINSSALSFLYSPIISKYILLELRDNLTVYWSLLCLLESLKNWVSKNMSFLLHHSQYWIPFRRTLEFDISYLELEWRRIAYCESVYSCLTIMANWQQ